MHLYIALGRIEQGCYVPAAESDVQKLEGTRENAAAFQIAANIKDALGVSMHDEIAGCQRAHRDGRGRQGIVHTCGDGPQVLGELCIVGVGQHGPHQRGQAQAPLRLPARNADSVAWALFKR